MEAGVHLATRPIAGIRRWVIHLSGTQQKTSHIIDLAPIGADRSTAPLKAVRRHGLPRATIVVGTKRQAQRSGADAASVRAIFSHSRARWHADQLDRPSRQSISRWRSLNEMLSSNEAHGYPRKESLTLQREREQARTAPLDGIKDMGGIPTHVRNRYQQGRSPSRRANAWACCGGVVDTNCDPRGITFVVTASDARAP